MRQKDFVKHCSHIVLWAAAMTYVQCFILCFKEEGPRAVTALYFGWLAFCNRHFVIGGGGSFGFSFFLSLSSVVGPRFIAMGSSIMPAGCPTL